MLSIRSLLLQSIKKLHSSDSSVLDSEVLLSWVIKKSKEFLFAHPEFAPTAKQTSQFKKLITQRAKGKPIAYLVGRKEFFGLNFEVNKNVLIPRPETESMVEEVLKKIDCPKTTLIDVGTGSGCIPIAILKNLKPELKDKIRALAIDISAPALRVASRNAKKHGVKIKFLRGNLIEPIIKKLTLYLNGAEKIIITANLPYLIAKQYRQNPALRFESKSALVADKSLPRRQASGLALYEKLLKQIKTYSLDSRFRENDNRETFTLFLEIDPSQAHAIKIIIKKYLPQAEVKIKKDYAGKNRLVIIHFP